MTASAAAAAAPLRLDVLTIFPEYLAPLHQALLGKAIDKGLIEVGIHNFRDWTHDVHKSVDDTPYGGGPGMVMKPQVVGEALRDIVGITDEQAPGVQEGGPVLIVPTPAGEPFTQQMAAQLAEHNHLVFACGRYEGIDQRAVDHLADYVEVKEVSLGDYVLIGGEVAVLVMAEAICRLRPGVLGNQKSHEEDSFQDGLLEGPSYTKPFSWRERDVPGVLLSGNHAHVDRWRRDMSLLRTQARRPELLDAVELSARDREVLESGVSPLSDDC